LLFYQPQIEYLIAQRDEYIASLSTADADDVFVDKTHYQLSVTDVDLTHDLTQTISTQTTHEHSNQQL